MEKYPAWLIILALCIVLLVPKDLIAQDCEVPEVLRKYYEADVKHLALKRMEIYDAPELNEIEVDSMWQDTIWKALGAVFMSSFPERDSVFDLYCIHNDAWTSSNYPRISNRISLKLDQQATWYQQWADGNIVTGVMWIDSLLQLYGFDEVDHWFSGLDYYSLSTTQYLNLPPLVALLAQHPSFLVISPAGGAGGSKTIEYLIFDDYQRFEFRIGWEDCPSGCIYSRSWFFRVEEGCYVDDPSTWGKPIEFEPEYCNITTAIAKPEKDNYGMLMITPNPATAEITIALDSHSFDALVFEIMEITGQHVHSGKISVGDRMDISHLAEGMYVLMVREEKGRAYVGTFVRL